MESSSWMRWMFWMFWMFLFLFSVDVLAGADASGQPSPASLSCSVRRADGAFEYQLSRPPPPSSCHQTWEQENKTMIAEDSYRDPTLVQNQTDRAIVLYRCLDYVHYSENCQGIWTEAHCRENCSLLVMKNHTPTVNEPLICFSPSLCVAPWSVAVVTAIVGLLVIVGIVVCFRKSIFKCCRRQTAYSEPGKVELQDFV